MSEWTEYVDSEGGPLLLADPEAASSWRGIDDGGRDYSDVCSVFDRDDNLEGFEWPVADDTVFIWEMRGAGTAFIHVPQPATVLVLRAWVDDDSQLNDLAEAARHEHGSILGQLSLRNPCLFVCWAVENGSCLKKNPSGFFEIDTRALATCDTAILVPTPPGLYSITHVNLEMHGFAGRCLKLTRTAGGLATIGAGGGAATDRRADGPDG